MNIAIIPYVLGGIMAVEAAFMTLPMLCSLLYREPDWVWFLAVALGELLAAGLLLHRKPRSRVFYMREGCVCTALAWLVLSAVGALPFWLSGSIPHYPDALFETISGFTTTGASILPDVEALSHGMLFWRSFTHWLGGMGVLVFLLAVVQMPGGSHMNLMKAESPGPQVGKLRPKVRQTAQILYLIYLGLTVVQILLLLLGRISLFDALTTAFGTAGTGGFGVRADSLAGYSPYIQWVTGIFMVLFGVNFNFFYYLLLRRWKEAFSMEEVRGYLLIVAGAIGLILLDMRRFGLPFGELLRHVFFTVSSVITTTGYATMDFNLWPAASRTVLVLLMFIGACAGSTGGGTKVSRTIVMVKAVGRELDAYIHPKSVRHINMDHKPLDRDVLRGIYVYYLAYFLLFVLSVLLISFEGYGLVTNFTAVVATFNNIGPGLELVGPAGNFGFFSDLSKWILMFDMLAGRLELFPVLVLLYPATWRGTRPYNGNYN